jgi:putative methionine-R-sulfoxide reductase with GAF domain
MSAHSSLDPGRESLQSLLSIAFAVQESGLSVLSRSVMAQVQRLNTTNDCGADHVMQVIVGSASKIANAAGVGIALLEGDQLVYRATSGSGAAYVGKRMTAVLTTPGHQVSQTEIVRVENALTDSRIQAAICRELGAMSLLILPISHNGAIAGVLAIFFHEPHTFLEREVATYRIITRIIEQVIARTKARKIGCGYSLTTQVAAVASVSEPTTQSIQVPGDGRRAGRVPRLKSALDPIRVTGSVANKRLKLLWYRIAPGTTTTHFLPRPLFDTLRWNLVGLLVVVALALLVNWSSHHPISSIENSAGAHSTTTDRVMSPTRRQAAKHHTSRWPAQPVTAEREKRLPGRGFRKVKVAQNEVDYIAEDVTVRRFGPNSSSQGAWLQKQQFEIGDDVTVRYFEPGTTASKDSGTADLPPAIPH